VLIIKYDLKSIVRHAFGVAKVCRLLLFLKWRKRKIEANKKAITMKGIADVF
jgi:hypothetical protein